MVIRLVFRQGTRMARMERITMDLFLMEERIDEGYIFIFSDNLCLSAKSALSAFKIRCKLTNNEKLKPIA